MSKKLLLTLALLITAITTMGQNAPGPRIEITGVNATQMPTITVTANVYDSFGQPVRGLTAADFSLVDQIASLGTIVDVANVSDDNLAFAVVLVIDTSSSMDGMPFLRAQEAARTFINSIGPNDPVAIYDFDSNVVLVQDYTTDKTALLNAIDSLTLGGKTALYQAALEGVLKAAEAPLPRRAVVLLSDGAEYGGLSQAARRDALEEARQSGPPVYTIGLGYGADRTYLTELADNTNAHFYESPTPDELVTIYQDLASTLRSQYVLTLNADLPLDGTEYTLGLQVTTPEGTASTTSTLRAPIPVPIVRFEAPSGPISEVTTITANIAADDNIVSAEADIDGISAGTFAEPPYDVPIDPFALSPGTHTLTFSATDDTGDTGTGSVDFEVAALPPVISMETNIGVPAAEVAEPLVVTIDAVSQTPISGGTHSLDGDTPQDFTGGLPFILNIDPQVMAPGEHTLTVTLTNQGGASASADLTFTVAALPPVIAINNLVDGQTVDAATTATVLVVASQSQTADITATLNGEVAGVFEDALTADITIDPAQLPPGDAELAVIATDANGQASTQTVSFQVAALPPEVTVSGIQLGETLDENRTVTVDAGGQTPITSVTFNIDGQEAETQTEALFSYELDVLSLSPETHILSVVVENDGGQSTTVDIPFAVSEGPSLTATAMAQPTDTPTPGPTPTPQPSQTPNTAATNTEAAAQTAIVRETQAAADAQATNDAAVIQMMTQEPVDGTQAQATLDVRNTAAAQETANAQATSDAQATADAQAQANERATSTAIAILITATFEAQGTANAQAAVEAQATSDARATRNAARTATAEAEQATANAQATTNAEATATAGAEVAQAPTEATEEATAEVTTGAPTEEATEAVQAPSATPGRESVTRTPAATPPSVGTMTTETVQEQPPASSDTTPILVIIVAVIVILLVVYFVLRSGRRSRT